MNGVTGPNNLRLNDLILSVDIETSGTDPYNTDVLELAAIVSPLHPEMYPIDRFHCFFKHENVRWDESTREFHQKNGYFEYMDMMLRNSKPHYTPSEFITNFKSWTKRHGIWSPKFVDAMNNVYDKGTSITAVGKNFTSFDLQYLNNLPGVNFKEYRFFRHRAIDIGNLLWNPLIDGAILPSSEICMERGGVGKAGDYKHRAMDDAEMMLTLMKSCIKKWLVTHS